jgi:hypothetical protein
MIKQLKLFWVEDICKPGFYVCPNYRVVAWNGKDIFAQGSNSTYESDKRLPSR